MPAPTYLLVEGVEIEVQHGRRVPGYERPSAHEPAGLVVRQHRERSSAALCRRRRRHNTKLCKRQADKTDSRTVVRSEVAHVCMCWCR